MDDDKREKVEDWIDYISDKVIHNYAGRKVILWGSYQVSYEISNKLKEKYGINVAFYVDGDAKKVDNVHVFSIDCLCGKAKEYYIVIPLAFYESIKSKLIREGYKSEIDFYYFSDCILRQQEDYYEDAHGNKIVGKYKGIKFAFSGFNSIITIGDHTYFQDTCIYIHNESKVTIGNECCFLNSRIFVKHSASVEFDDKVELYESEVTVSDKAELQMKYGCNAQQFLLGIKRYSKVLLGENTKIGLGRFDETSWQVEENAILKSGNNNFFVGGRLGLFESSFLQIGNAFRVGKNYDIMVEGYSSISIGNDCLFSYDVYMRSGDGHAIFDIRTGENINSTYEISKKRKIDIGNHVWIGMRVTVLYNTVIYDGSIIGAMSLVKGIIPNNCIATGVPAKVIRKNVAWSMENFAEDIAECGEEYINYTE